MDKYKTVNDSTRGLIILYIVSCAIGFISKIGTEISSGNIRNIIFIFWIGIAFLKLIKNKFKVSKEDLSIKHFFLIFIIPVIIVHIYSILLYIMGKTQYISTNLKTYIIAFSVFSILYIFKNTALTYTIIGALLSFFIVIIYDCLVFGITSITDTLKFILTGSELYYNSARLFEVHDYTFALGYIVLYYLLIKKGKTKKEVIYIYCFIIFLFLGLKRIQILAIIMIIIFYWISKFIKNKYGLYKFTSWIFISISYLFIFTLSNNTFFEIVNKLGINTMGRIYYYKTIMNLCKFSPSFLGFGRNSLTYILNNDYAYLRVSGVHSDILKYFAECGFVLFGIWLWYFLLKVVGWIRNRYSFNMVTTYYILTLYTFIIYFTDNIDTYFISQYMYMMICGTIALKSYNYENDTKK